MHFPLFMENLFIKNGYSQSGSLSNHRHPYNSHHQHREHHYPTINKNALPSLSLSIQPCQYDHKPTINTTTIINYTTNNINLYLNIAVLLIILLQRFPLPLPQPLCHHLHHCLTTTLTIITTTQPLPPATTQKLLNKAILK